MRRPAFCMCENKDADQLRGNREADQSRHSEFQIFPVPDRFRNRQTVLFYEKRIFIGPKNGTFYLSN